MKKTYNANGEKILLSQGIALIEQFNCHFFAYNTKFLGYSYDDNYVIDGKATKNSKSLHEFCYGRDGQHQETHLLSVYQLDDKTKYAATEVSFGVYGYWKIID